MIPAAAPLMHGAKYTTDPIKLGVPGFEATDESEVTLVWRLVFPTSTPGAKIVRRATEKYRDAVAQMHRLVQTLEE